MELDGYTLTEGFPRHIHSPSTKTLLPLHGKVHIRSAALHCTAPHGTAPCKLLTCPLTVMHLRNVLEDMALEVLCGAVCVCSLQRQSLTW